MNKIISFGAEWCGGCRAMKPQFKEFQTDLKGINNEIEVIDLNVDESPTETELYKIYSIPYTVFIKEGKVEKGFRGTMTKSQLMEAYKEVYN